MAKAAYIGLSSSSRKVKQIYIGISSVAKKIKKAYIGVNNGARLWWKAPISYESVSLSYLSDSPSFPDGQQIWACTNHIFFYTGNRNNFRYNAIDKNGVLTQLQIDATTYYSSSAYHVSEYPNSTCTGNYVIGSTVGSSSSRSEPRFTYAISDANLTVSAVPDVWGSYKSLRTYASATGMSYPSYGYGIYVSGSTCDTVYKISNNLTTSSYDIYVEYYYTSVMQLDNYFIVINSEASSSYDEIYNATTMVLYRQVYKGDASSFHGYSGRYCKQLNDSAICVYDYSTRSEYGAYRVNRSFVVSQLAVPSFMNANIRVDAYATLDDEMFCFFNGIDAEDGTQYTIFSYDSNFLLNLHEDLHFPSGSQCAYGAETFNGKIYIPDAKNSSSNPIRTYFVIS